MTELEFSYETLENPWDFSHSENEYRQYLMEHHKYRRYVNGSISAFLLRTGRKNSNG